MNINLNDYFLVRCFEEQEYRDSFNNGTCFYVNNMKKFWEFENTFQNDLEGCVLNFKGTINGYAVDFEPEGKVDRNFFDKIKTEGKHIATAEGINISISGYIYCFYLLPKTSIEVRNNKMFFTNDKAHLDFVTCIEKYLEEKEECYVSIYDAMPLCNILSTELSKRKYGFIFDEVKYIDLSDKEKSEMFNNGELKKLVFTKPTEFDYQKEFRIFITKSGQNDKDNISEEGIVVKPSFIGNFECKQKNK
jgi:hypothetical protein